MTPEALVEHIRKAIPDRLAAAVLYGSAAAGDFVTATSDYNVLLVVDRLGLAELDAIAKSVAQWTKEGHRPPLLFQREQLAASVDAFPIEWLDMQQSHRVLFGEDPLNGATVKAEDLRLQVERELTEKILKLREGYVLAVGRSEQVLGLLVASVSGVLVLFRAALRLFEESIPSAKIDALRQLAKHVAFDPQPFVDVVDMKRRRNAEGGPSPVTLFGSYLNAIEQVAEAVDRRLQTVSQSHPETGC